MSDTTHERYRDGRYYEETYLPYAMDLATSTRWMANYLRAVRRVLPSLDSWRARRVLEVGSSFGGFVNLLNCRGFEEVVASDLNPRLFPKELKNRFLAVDLLDEAPLGETFDLIFAFDVLEHIDDSPRVVARLRELLAGEGVFVFCVPYPARKHLLDNYHTNMQRPEFWTNMFRQRGFELLGLEFASFLPGIWRFGVPVVLRRVVESRLFASQVFFSFRKLG